ncbi:hypothetical protein RvY_08156 [Ramazzottius varieornatus]|uniref:BOD1/SHG1 domain-containing protein n=1 Tax=Ramazzottius varieornatus TaxID=947166 RepID=A0A1D1V4U4_RAMVA|nr:hypothetical protein RvY_08156 [Ramazzottius varieornatus]
MDSLACYTSESEPSSSGAFNGFPLEISDNFDIDEAQLVELYKRIPPPHLRAYALTHTKDKVVGDIAQRVKDEGHFDTFRKTWLKDLETKPQFQNLVRRVEMQCDEYLKGLKWTPDMDKTAARENLRKKIASASFVDTGIQGLLQEIHTGRYSNPIPLQRFNEALTSIVGETVQKYIQLGTLDFPRLGKAADNTHFDDFDSCNVSLPRATTPTQVNSTDQPRREIASRNMFRESPDLVEMEISSPETESTMEDGEIRSSTAASADSALDGRPESRAKSTGPHDLPRNTEDFQGALDLLMFSGNGQWGNDFDSDSQIEGSQTESSPPVETSPVRPTLISPTPGTTSSTPPIPPPPAIPKFPLPPPLPSLPPLMPFPPPPLPTSRLKRSVDSSSNSSLSSDSSPAVLIKHIVAMTNTNPSLAQPLSAESIVKKKEEDDDTDETSSAFWRNKWKKAKKSKEKPADEAPPPKKVTSSNTPPKVTSAGLTVSSIPLPAPVSPAESDEKVLPDSKSVEAEVEPEVKTEVVSTDTQPVIKQHTPPPPPAEETIPEVQPTETLVRSEEKVSAEEESLRKQEEKVPEVEGVTSVEADRSSELPGSLSPVGGDTTDAVPSTSCGVLSVLGSAPILLKVEKVERRKSVGTKKVVLVKVPKEKKVQSKTSVNSTTEETVSTFSEVAQVLNVPSVRALSEASQVVMVDSASSRPARNRKSNSRYTEDFVTAPKTLVKVTAAVKMPVRRKLSKSEQGMVEEQPPMMNTPMVLPTSAPIPLVIRSESPAPTSTPSRPIVLTVKKAGTSSNKKQKTTQ